MQTSSWRRGSRGSIRETTIWISRRLAAGRATVTMQWWEVSPRIRPLPRSTLAMPMVVRLTSRQSLLAGMGRLTRDWRCMIGQIMPGAVWSRRPCCRACLVRLQLRLISISECTPFQMEYCDSLQWRMTASHGRSLATSRRYRVRPLTFEGCGKMVRALVRNSFNRQICSARHML